MTSWTRNNLIAFAERYSNIKNLNILAANNGYGNSKGKYDGLFGKEKKRLNVLVGTTLDIGTNHITYVLPILKIGSSRYSLISRYDDYNFRNPELAKMEKLFYLDFQEIADIGTPKVTKLAVAGLYKDNLYIFIERVIENRVFGAKALEEIFKQLPKGKIVSKVKKNKVNVEQLLDGISRRKKERLSRIIDSSKGDIDRSLSMIKSAKDKIKQDTIKLEAIDGSVGKEMKKRINLALKSANIEDIVVNGLNVVVLTKDITLKRSNIGKYIIDIDFNTDSLLSGIRVTRQIPPEPGYDYDHPHINDGRPCWGNIKLKMAQYLNSNDLLSIIETTIVFLSSYYENGAYTPWSDFKTHINIKPKTRKTEKQASKVSRIAEIVDNNIGTTAVDTAPMPTNNNYPF